MKIDPERLRILRKQKGLTRLELAKRSNLSERTIQRLENEPDRSQKSQEHTLNSLAKALGVESGVLTGELPLPESDNAPAENPDLVQIGAKITPKARLAYDLIKRRYGVSATEVINMAPLFFVLLAEGCLAQRRETAKKADEAIDLLNEYAEIEHGISSEPVHYVYEAYVLIEESIEKADLFGELFSDSHFPLLVPSDSTEGNPFANYLRKLAEELNNAGVVNVDEGTLDLGGVSRSKHKFPYYDICGDELNRIANGSPDAKRTLETGCARLSEIPKELMGEDADEKRAEWLKGKLLDIFKIAPKEIVNTLATAAADDPEVKKKLEELTTKKGDDQ